MMSALNPQAADQDMANNPFAQMMNNMGDFPQGPPGAGGPIDDAKIQEASKMFEDCINQIQKETDPVAILVLLQPIPT